MGCCRSRAVWNDDTLVYVKQYGNPGNETNDGVFRVLVGPVIGTVHSHGGRVLLETNRAGKIVLA